VTWRERLSGRPPAVQAALIQCLAFVLTVALAYLLSYLPQQRVLPVFLPVSIGGAVLLQGALAFMITYLRRLAPWWCAIQLLFPAALAATLALHLPPALFLFAFLLLLGLYWSTFRTQVPFYPSGPKVWNAVAALLPAQRPARLIDIGSGLGGLALNLARRRPDCSVSGIELAPLPWAISRLRAYCSGNRARFVRGDYENLDFADYDVVFAYLSPAAMAALWRKAHAQMRSGAMLLSYEFAIEGRAPDRAIHPTVGGPVLYVWQF
jgi:SAM-dependent methyltransferase